MGKAPVLATKRKIVKKSRNAKYQQLKQAINKLSIKDIKEIMQFAPFCRLVKSKLSHDVKNVSSATHMQLFEATIQFINDIYRDSYNITTDVGQRKTLMMRDLMATIKNKGANVYGV